MLARSDGQDGRSSPRRSIRRTTRSRPARSAAGLTVTTRCDSEIVQLGTAPTHRRLTPAGEPTTAAWRGHAAGRGEDAVARLCMPSTSSGHRFLDGPAGHVSALMPVQLDRFFSGERRAYRTTAPGDAGRPTRHRRQLALALALGSKDRQPAAGSASLAGIRPCASPSSRLDQLFGLTMSQAILTAACTGTLTGTGLQHEHLAPSRR